MMSWSAIKATINSVLSGLLFLTIGVMGIAIGGLLSSIFRLYLERPHPILLITLAGEVITVFAALLLLASGGLRPLMVVAVLAMTVIWLGAVVTIGYATMDELPPAQASSAPSEPDVESVLDPW